MGTCTHHPERETSMMCSKYGVYMCAECMECRDPDIYCKFREACPIWYEHKNKAREARRRTEMAAEDSGESNMQPEGKVSQID